MTSPRLFPRLSASAARRLLREFDEAPLDPERLQSAAQPFTTWAASGGRRASPDELQEIRTAILEVARACGYPNGGEREARAFDAGCTMWFGETDPVPCGEALRDDVWTWIGVCLLPDLVSWRFKGRADERFVGGVRNTFQRHWTRARVFDRGADASDRWHLVSALSEDAMVQVVERPSVGSSPQIARAIGEAWLSIVAEQPGVPMELLARTAIRDLRILGASVALTGMRQDALNKLTAKVFAAAAARLTRDTQPAPRPAPRRSILDTLLRRDG